VRVAVAVAVLMFVCAHGFLLGKELRDKGSPLTFSP